MKSINQIINQQKLDHFGQFIYLIFSFKSGPSQPWCLFLPLAGGLGLEKIAKKIPEQGIEP